MSKTADMQWRKCWRQGTRSTAFNGLPFLTRAVAAELLAWADNDGRIVLGKGDEVAALMRLVGAHPRERRTVAKHVDLLLERGTIDLCDGVLVFPNWGHYQAESRPKTRTGATRGVHRDDTRRASGVHPDDIGRASGLHEVCPNPAESLGPILQEGEGEKEGEKEGEGSARKVGFLGGYSEVYQRLTKSLLLDYERHRWAIDEIEGLLRRSGEPKAALRALLVGIEHDDWMVSNGLPLPAIAKQVDKLIAQGAAKLRAQSPTRAVVPPRFDTITAFDTGQPMWRDRKTGAQWVDGQEPPDECAEAFRRFRERSAA